VSLYRADGIEPVRISKREALAWSTRVREALREFDAAVRSGDVDQLVAWAHEASACGAELENIADTTADAAAAEREWEARTERTNR
jgi:hypothetical protein